MYENCKRSENGKVHGLKYNLFNLAMKKKTHNCNNNSGNSKIFFKDDFALKNSSKKLSFDPFEAI